MKMMGWQLGFGPEKGEGSFVILTHLHMGIGATFFCICERDKYII